MTGTEDLFPGAPEVAAVSLPRESDPSRAGSHALGLIALVVGLFANAANIGGLAAAYVTAAAVLGNSDRLDRLGWVGPFVAGVVVLAVALGLVAIIVGVRAVSRHRGRIPGLMGAILGGLALVVILLVASATALFAFAPA